MDQFLTHLAFILYRQHYQAAVVARYPKLTNPDISKIIGEQWKNCGSIEKNQWKRAAEVRNSGAVG
jgi:HMG box factor, other